MERSNTLSAQSKMFYKTAKKVGAFVEVTAVDPLAKLLLRCHVIVMPRPHGPLIRQPSRPYVVVQNILRDGMFSVLHGCCGGPDACRPVPEYVQSSLIPMEVFGSCRCHHTLPSWQVLVCTR